MRSLKSAFLLLLLFIPAFSMEIKKKQNAIENIRDYFKYYADIKKGIIQAIDDRQLDVIKTIMKSKSFTVELHRKAIFHAFNLLENELLDLGSGEDNEEIIATLLSKDIDIELDDEKTTPLLYCFFDRYCSYMVPTLVQAGADVTKKNKHENSVVTSYKKDMSNEFLYPIIQDYIEKYVPKNLECMNLENPTSLLKKTLKYNNTAFSVLIAQKYPESFLSLWANPHNNSEKKELLQYFFYGAFRKEAERDDILLKIINARDFQLFIDLLHQEDIYRALRLAIQHKNKNFANYVVSQTKNIDFFKKIYKGWNIFSYTGAVNPKMLPKLSKHAKNNIIEQFIQTIEKNDVNNLKKILSTEITPEQIRILGRDYTLKIIKDEFKNLTINKNDTFLSRACHLGHKEIVEILIHEGSHANDQDGIAWIQAIRSKNQEIFDILLKKYQEISTPTGIFLDEALKHRCIPALKTFFNNFPVVAEKLFLMAPEEDNLETRELIKKTGLDARAMFNNALALNREELALLFAKKDQKTVEEVLTQEISTKIHRDEEKVRTILNILNKGDCDIHSLNILHGNKKWPLLIDLIDEKFSNTTVELALELGADSNAQKDGESVLYYAAKSSELNLQTFKKLWNHKNANLLNNDDESILIAACASEGPHMYDKVKYILEKCIDDPAHGTMQKELCSGKALESIYQPELYLTVLNLLITAGAPLKRKYFSTNKSELLKFYLCRARCDQLCKTFKTDLSINIKNVLQSSNNVNLFNYIKTVVYDTPDSWNSNLTLSEKARTYIESLNKEKTAINIAKQMKLLLNEYKKNIRLACCMKSGRDTLEMLLPQIDDQSLEHILDDLLLLKINNTLNINTLTPLIKIIFKNNTESRERILNKIKKTMQGLIDVKNTRDFKASVYNLVRQETLKILPPDAHFYFEKA